MNVELEKEIQTLVVAKFLYDIFEYYKENKGMEIVSILERYKPFKKWFPDVKLNELIKDKRYEKIVFQHKEDVFKELTLRFELYQQLISLRKKDDIIMIKLGNLKKRLALLLAIPKEYPIPILSVADRRDLKLIKTFRCITIWVNAKGKIEEVKNSAANHK